ncbi:MAG: DUF167 domain-containing protein [Patescibacteria group bacterium]|nr:DUF167 domain-containing protein [Patescibacteria group bacterium]
MKITVIVKPNSKKESVEELVDGGLRVSVKEPALEGKANTAAIGVVAKHFNVSRSSVKIVSGLSSRRKVFDIVI